MKRFFRKAGRASRRKMARAAVKTVATRAQREVTKRAKGLGKGTARATGGRSLGTLVVLATLTAIAYIASPDIKRTLDTAQEHVLRFLEGEQPVLVAADPNATPLPTAFTDCPGFFVQGQAPLVPAQPLLREVCLAGFAALHSGATRTPVFIAQKLDRDMLRQGKPLRRTDRFHEEARLPKSHRATLADYRNSGYSRGHMAPAGDMHTSEAMAQSFSLVNIVPQDQAHNAGPWAVIERSTRDYVERTGGPVHVFTGPVFGETIETIGDSRVAVPQYLYKVVYDATTQKACVHWHENQPQTRVKSPISYREFLSYTGLQLLPEAVVSSPDFRDYGSFGSSPCD